MNYIEEDNRFVAYNDKKQEVGEVTFTRAGETMFIIDHTFVKEGYNGQGIAQELVRLVVDKARTENKLIIPLCPFAKKKKKKKAEYHDVLKK